MSKATVLYRFHLDVSDVERSVYETLDFRLAMHASESFAFLLTRVIAYALNVQHGLTFSLEGLANPDEPCMSSDDPRGGKDLWIEVGSPSAKRLHKASKAARRVRVYTYKNPEALLEEIRAAEIYQSEKIEIFSLDQDFLERLERMLTRNNTWGIVYDQGNLLVSSGELSEPGDLRPQRLR